MIYLGKSEKDKPVAKEKIRHLGEFTPVTKYEKWINNNSFLPQITSLWDKKKMFSTENLFGFEWDIN